MVTPTPKPDPTLRRAYRRRLIERATSPSPEVTFVVGWVAGAASAAVIAALIAQNSVRASAQWFVFTWTPRLWVLLMLAALVGLALARVIPGLVHRVRDRPPLRRPAPITWIIAGAVGFTVFLPFLVQNWDRTRYEVLWLDLRLPLALSLLVAALLGAAAVPVSHRVSIPFRRVLDARDAAREELLEANSPDSAGGETSAP